MTTRACRPPWATTNETISRGGQYLADPRSPNPASRYQFGGRTPANGGTTRQVAFEVGFNVTVVIALGRAGGVVIGAVRSLMSRRRFEVVRFGWSRRSRCWSRWLLPPPRSSY